MDCTTCQGTFVYTTYVRVMRRSEKTHRSRQTWQAMGRYCMNCQTFTDTLEEPMQKAILTRRLNQDRQMKLTLEDVDIPAL